MLVGAPIRSGHRRRRAPGQRFLSPASGPDLGVSIRRPVTIEPVEDPDGLVVTNTLSVQPSQERGVVIPERQFKRLMEHLESCKPHGWVDLWLAGVGVGTALAVGALVGVLTLPSDLSDRRVVLWVLAGAGGLMAILCLLAYLTQRRSHGEQIDELKRDFEMYIGFKS